MDNSQKIVDYLNSLIEDQPELKDFLAVCGVPANQKLIERSDINVRLCSDDKHYVTISGIIYQIGKILGQGISTKWDIEEGKNDFVCFQLEGDSEDAD